MKYQSKLDPAVLLQAARKGLSGSDPEAFKALLLAVGAGLRRGEIDRLLWRQIDFNAGVIHVETTEAGGLKRRGEMFQSISVLGGSSKSAGSIRHRGGNRIHGFQALGPTLPLRGCLLPSHAMAPKGWCGRQQAPSHVAEGGWGHDCYC